jgi:tRNA (mo5U34)-methyltransferase
MVTRTFEYVPGLKAMFESKGWWHSFELPDGRKIDGVNTVEGLRKRIEVQTIPQDLSGARVLDIGAWDGWYSFEMERRGAQVLAIDCWDNPRFHQMRAALKSRVEYRQMDVYELSPQTVGHFDIVLFMGVLYHLKHPLLALEKVCAITSGMAVVDSFILRVEHLPGALVETRPVMEFYETDEFGGQTDNWCGPSLPCLMAMCRTAGFARVEHRATLPLGACISCYRKWEPSSEQATKVPRLVEAVHNTNFGINFDTRRDEYVSALFQFPEAFVTLDSVQPQVGEFGIRGIHVSSLDSGAWQINFKLPPGLEAGWHDVTVRVDGGPASNAKRIAVDLPANTAELKITAVADGTTWQPNSLDLREGNVLVLWIVGLPENADRANVRVFLGGQRLPVVFAGAGQVNAEVPDDAPSGRFEVEAEMNVGARSAPMAIEISGVGGEPTRSTTNDGP